MTLPARLAVSGGLLLALLSAAARADDGAWTDSLALSAQFDVGIGHAGAVGPSGRLFGRLFDDVNDRPQLDQALLTAARPLDPAASGYDFGFKLQGMFGSDARYSRFTRQFVDLTDNGMNQFDIVEANLLLHAPWLSEGGVDVKLGQYATPMGAETVDASANYFYSHSYIFNFATPLKHSGLLATWHAGAQFDLYGSLDSGVNTGWQGFPGHAQNHGPPAFLGGAGLTLADGALSLLALLHVGTEIPAAAVVNGLLPRGVAVDGAWRRIADLVTTWKASDDLTLVNETAWVHDDALDGGRPADAYGTAQYASLAITEHLALVGRGEIFVDAENAFVSQFGANADLLRAEQGYPALSPYTLAGGRLGGRTVYGAATIGLTWKPNAPLLSALTIRPELRQDAALSGGHPFRDGGERGQTTLSVDAILLF